MDKHNLVSVDADLIRDLRQQGRWKEARNLLDSWRENVEKEKKQAKREIDAVIRKKLKVHGICPYCECRPSEDGLVTCPDCRLRISESNYRMRHKSQRSQ